MKTGMMVTLWIFLLFGNMGCLGSDSEETTVRSNEQNPNQKSFLPTKKSEVFPSIPDNSETLPSIIVDDPLLNLSIKEFKKVY